MSQFGVGEVVEIETVADIRLAGRAINEDWPVTQELRGSLIQQMQDILTAGDPELCIAAAKVLLAADALNAKKREVEQRKLDAEHARKLQLIELAVKLGIARPDPESVGSPDRIAS